MQISEMSKAQFESYFKEQCPIEDGDFDSIYEEVSVCKTCKYNESQSDFNKRCGLLNQRKDKNATRRKQNLTY